MTCFKICVNEYRKYRIHAFWNIKNAEILKIYEKFFEKLEKKELIKI